MFISDEVKSIINKDKVLHLDSNLSIEKGVIASFIMFNKGIPEFGFGNMLHIPSTLVFMLNKLNIPIPYK